MVKSNRFLAGLAIALLMIFAVANYFFPGGLQQITLWVCVPGAAVLAFFAVPHHKASKYMKLQIALYLWVAFTALFAFRYDLALQQLRRIVVCFLMLYSINQLAKDYKLTMWLYIVFVLYYAGIVYYARTHILTDFYDYTEDRLDDNILNANVVAYFTFFTTFIVYILGDTVKKKGWSWILRLVFLLSPVWSFVIALLTASRQVIIIQVPLILLLLYLRYMKNKNPMVKLLFVFFGIAIGVFLVSKGISAYEGSYLSQRNEDIEIGEDVRTVLIRRAIHVGATHPIVGVGPGCFGMYGMHRNTFSHNTFTELFANCGLPALALFVALLGKFLVVQWRRYKRYKDNIFLVFFSFGLMYVVDNMFYVFYTMPWLIAFFFLVAQHSDNYYELNYCQEEMEDQPSLTVSES